MPGRRKRQPAARDNCSKRLRLCDESVRVRCENTAAARRRRPRLRPAHASPRALGGAVRAQSLTDCLNEFKVPMLAQREVRAVVEDGELRVGLCGECLLDHVHHRRHRRIQIALLWVKFARADHHDLPPLSVLTKQLDLALLELGDEGLGDRDGNRRRAPFHVLLDHRYHLCIAQLARDDESAQCRLVLYDRVRASELVSDLPLDEFDVFRDLRVVRRAVVAQQPLDHLGTRLTEWHC